MKDLIIDLIVMLFLFLPLTVLIHELGHAFFVKVFKGTMKKITIGTGKTIFRFKKLEFKTFFCFGGEYSYTKSKINNKSSRILIHMGGVLFNIISAIFLYCLLMLRLFTYGHLIIIFLEIQVLLSILNILPLTIRGTDTDGKQLLHLIMDERLSQLLKDEKNYDAIIAKLSAETTRLKKASERTIYEFMKSKYIRKVFYKAQIEQEMGRIKDAAMTLKEIYSKISNQPVNLQIAYYNNLLYDSIISHCTDDVDEVYNKLIELLSIKENKIYENSAILDTIETYKAYKSALQ